MVSKRLENISILTETTITLSVCSLVPQNYAEIENKNCNTEKPSVSANPQIFRASYDPDTSNNFLNSISLSIFSNNAYFVHHTYQVIRL